MSTDILTVVVGSRLHGLATEDSDVDYRGVFVNDLADIVNPFEKPDDNRFIEGKGKDDTASELRKFVREVVQGNPNSIEVLFSNQVVGEGTTSLGHAMQDYAERFIDTGNVFNAYKNYSANQLNKMNLFTPDKRTPKFAVAYIRSLWNGIELLRTGRITNPVPTWISIKGQTVNLRDALMCIKYTPPEQFDSVREMATGLFTQLQLTLADEFYSRQPKDADKDWIVEFVRGAYGVYRP